MKKNEKKGQPENTKAMEENGRKELDAEGLDNVTGGGSFIDIPRVKEYDYDDSVTDRV